MAEWFRVRLKQIDIKKRTQRERDQIDRQESSNRLILSKEAVGGQRLLHKMSQSFFYKQTDKRGSMYLFLAAPSFSKMKKKKKDGGKEHKFALARQINQLKKRRRKL